MNNAKKLDLTKLTSRVVIDTEKVIAQIHKNDPAKAPLEKSVRTTIDIPKSVHKRIKMKIYEKEITIREYILELVKKDLNS